MPRYTFELHNGQSPVSDDAWFTDREHAFDHAQHVARELMHGRELRTRSWRLDVYENGKCVRQGPVASVDETLDHLNPALRETIEISHERILGLREAVSLSRTTRREARALVARSRGKPYLVTEAGQPTIKTSPPDRGKRRRGTGKTGA